MFLSSNSLFLLMIFIVWCFIIPLLIICFWICSIFNWKFLSISIFGLFKFSFFIGGLIILFFPFAFGCFSNKLNLSLKDKLLSTFIDLLFLLLLLILFWICLISLSDSFFSCWLSSLSSSQFSSSSSLLSNILFVFLFSLLYFASFMNNETVFLSFVKL